MSFHRTPPFQPPQPRVPFTSVAGGIGWCVNTLGHEGRLLACEPTVVGILSTLLPVLVLFLRSCVVPGQFLHLSC